MSIVVNGNQAIITSDAVRRYFYVPANVKSGTVEYSLIGGGGGGGGTDYPYGGGAGSAAGVVTGTLSVNAGDLVELIVGGGGSRGESQRGGARGGAGGLSFAEYNGGTGGHAGYGGSSGGGGGGGGATVLKINGVPKAIAAGGGAGGGGGHWGGGVGDSATVTEGSFNQTTTDNYYSPTSNGAYCQFLNNYGVDIGDGHTNVTYQWDVYFPLTQNYNFYVSGDNEADILVDGVQVATTGGWGGGGGPFQNIFSGTISVSVGLHSVTINGRNYGGPGSVGGRIVSRSGESIDAAPVVVDPRTGTAKNGYYTRSGGINSELYGNERQYIVRYNNETVWDSTDPPPATYLPSTYRGSVYGISVSGAVTYGDGYPLDGSGQGDYLNAFDLALPGGTGNETEIWNSRNARKYSINTHGQQGTDHPGDGGGGGGGGGGYLGGGGGFSGESRGGDLGGGAGFIGRSYAEGGTVIAQITNKNATYGPYGVGGDAAYPGFGGTDGSGGSAIIFTNLITRNLRHKVNGTWMSTNNAYVKVGGTWKLCPEVWIKDNGTWKRSLLKTVAGVTWLSDGLGIAPNDPVPYVPTPVTPTTPTVPTTCPVYGTFLRDLVTTDKNDDGSVTTTTYKVRANGECDE